MRLLALHLLAKHPHPYARPLQNRNSFITVTTAYYATSVITNTLEKRAQKRTKLKQNNRGSLTLVLISVYHAFFLWPSKPPWRLDLGCEQRMGGFVGRGSHFIPWINRTQIFLAMAYLLSLGLMLNSIPICRLMFACVCVCAPSGVGVLFGGIVSGFEEPILWIKTSLRFCQIIRALWHQISVGGFYHYVKPTTISPLHYNKYCA